MGFEPAISAGERPQTHTLDRAATGTGEGDDMKEGIRHEARNTRERERQSSAEGFGCDAKKQEVPFYKTRHTLDYTKMYLNPLTL